GYYNRNRKEDLDIPVGPSNRIEPGGPDQGQPTHFLPGRQWGVFTITVPKDFGAKKLTWTIVANGQTTVVPASLDPLWEVSPFVEASGNTPPTIRFEGGASVQGPRPICETYRGTRKSGSGRRWRERDRFYLGYLQRARRIHPARCGQRLVGKRRARISVLLDECSGKSFRKALSNPAG